MDGVPNGQITNLQRFSLHDGPGVRSTLFLQGCNLQCVWCHNPESIPLAPVLLHYANRCVGCGHCVSICPQGALNAQAAKPNRARCQNCFACASACPNEALTPSSYAQAIDDALQAVLADLPFYESSGGGVTISGGEPMLQPAFTGALLHRLHALGVHTALDTAGLVSFARYEAVLPDVDLFLVDYKAFDSALHQRLTGVPNQLIRENIAKLSQQAKALWIRIPIVPGFNDAPGDLEAIARDLAQMGFSGQVEPLAFHSLGQAKYDALDRSYACAQTRPPGPERMAEIRILFAAHGLQVRG